MDKESGESWGPTKGGIRGHDRRNALAYRHLDRSIAGVDDPHPPLRLPVVGPVPDLQNITILVVSFLAVFGIIGGVWGSFGMRFSPP